MLAKEPRYAVLDWTKLPFDKLHDGYFAQDRKGIFKDTKGDTQADDDVYNLIMEGQGTVAVHRRAAAVYF